MISGSLAFCVKYFDIGKRKRGIHDDETIPVDGDYAEPCFAFVFVWHT